MKPWTLSPVLLLVGCKALETMQGTPADPANPAGPSQADALVTGITTTASAINPLYGGIAAAAIAAAYTTWKGKKVPPAPPAG